MYTVSLQSVRQKRATEIYRKLTPRLKTLAFPHALLSPEGALLSPAAAETTPPAKVPAFTSISCGVQVRQEPTGTWLLAPVGRATVDAWLACRVDATTDINLAKATLGFLIADAQQLLHLEKATGQLGERLATIYEQVRVLFGLTRLLDPAADARDVIHRVLSEIKAGLPFPWMALQFSNHIRLRKEVAGQLMIIGDNAPPEVESVVGDLLSNKPTRLTIIPSEDPAAQLLKTELVYVPVTYEGATVAVILAGGKTGEDSGISSFETQFLDACAELLSIFHENLARLSLQKALFLGVVHSLTSAIDAKHPYTRGHSERVSLLATLMAKRLGLDDATIATWKLSGLLHDVGKIGVPEAVLSKPAKLDDNEFALIKKHPAIGYEILKDIPGLEEALPGVIGHHEQWCGRGYPHGVAGTDIPLLARVLGLCDTFDAMSSSRSYRSALSRDVVLAEIKKCAGRQFDPELAELFIALDFTPYDEMYAEHTGQQILAA